MTSYIPYVIIVLFLASNGCAFVKLKFNNKKIQGIFYNKWRNIGSNYSKKLSRKFFSMAGKGKGKGNGKKSRRKSDSEPEDEAAMAAIANVNKQSEEKPKSAKKRKVISSNKKKSSPRKISQRNKSPRGANVSFAEVDHLVEMEVGDGVDLDVDPRQVVQEFPYGNDEEEEEDEEVILSQNNNATRIRGRQSTSREPSAERGCSSKKNASAERSNVCDEDTNGEDSVDESSEDSDVSDDQEEGEIYPVDEDQPQNAVASTSMASNTPVMTQDTLDKINQIHNLMTAGGMFGQSSALKENPTKRKETKKNKDRYDEVDREAYRKSNKGQDDRRSAKRDDNRNRKDHAGQNFVESGKTANSDTTIYKTAVQPMPK